MKAKVVVVMPAYLAERTIAKTFSEIPRGLVSEIIVVDDASPDKTFVESKKLGVIVYRHHHNLGYGGNQKTCYWEALKRKPDIIVMLHPDYQYDGTKIASLINPILKGECDIMFGSRIKNRTTALAGGMPKHKYLFNRLFTFVANIVTGENLSEYMSGLRAYSRQALEKIPYQRFSNDYVFDQQLTFFAIAQGLKIGEIPIPTRYHDQQHSINLAKGVKFGAESCWQIILFLLRKT